MNLKITVTAKDIRNGKTSQASFCPIALACHRLGYPGATVTHDYIRFNFDLGETSVPKKMTDWISKFDAGEVVKPFSFTVKNAPKPRSL